MDENPKSTSSSTAIIPSGSLLEKSTPESGDSMNSAAVISPETLALIEQALSPETLRAYRADVDRFNLWRLESGFREFSPEVVADWVASQHSAGYKISSITRGLSALKCLYPWTGEATRDPIVRLALKGARRGQIDRQVAKARPVTPDELERMCDVWPQTTTIGLRNRAILRLGWLCAARISELLSLHVSDLEWTAEGVAVLIRRSKTDKDGIGALIGVPHCEWLGEVRAWWERSKWLQQTFDAILFPRFRRGPDQIQASIVARRKLSARAARDMVYLSATRAGLSDVSPHSLRSGLITFAASIGVPERLIAAHSRHASIKVLRGYIHRGSIWKDNALDLVVRRLDG